MINMSVFYAAFLRTLRTEVRRLQLRSVVIILIIIIVSTHMLKAVLYMMQYLEYIKRTILNIKNMKTVSDLITLRPGC